MELFPALQIGWLNGWVLLVVLYSIFGILVLSSPKDVIRRLYDRSGWSREQAVLVRIGKLVTFAWLALAILTPLKTGSLVFILGLVILAVGIVGLVTALLNYRSTPPDEPVTKGFYRISRNPQALTLLVSFYGISIAVGSWLALFILTVSLVFHHLTVLAEEGSCLRQYGDSYRAYMRRVPRYFVFF